MKRYRVRTARRAVLRLMDLGVSELLDFQGWRPPEGEFELSRARFFRTWEEFDQVYAAVRSEMVSNPSGLFGSPKLAEARWQANRAGRVPPTQCEEWGGFA
jgi:hypothetical protein